MILDAGQLENETRVLLIYTGGTLGMLPNLGGGYVPEPGYLTETLRSQSKFHDPLQDSLFSNSATVEGYRAWSSRGGSGRASPMGANIPLAISPSHPLLVRSTRPIVNAVHPINLSAETKPSKTADGIYEGLLPSLVTPASTVPGGTSRKRIRYAILEWNPLLDSSNIDVDDWIRIATEIELNYQFDAFVILHGTDTMAFTASALSFLLEDLGKTVIITGAQIPLSQLRSDADNLMGALTIAGHYIIPECSLFFNHNLYRGNRASKVSSQDLSAFNSPNFPPLVDVGIDINVRWNNVIRQTGSRKFRAHKKMCANVATLRLFPGITSAAIRAFLMPPIQGVVLETFGAGNAPQRQDLMDALREACDRGVVIVAISQCQKGAVSDAYETGRTLLKAGVIPGGDMTPECALTKLSYLLSKSEFSIADIRGLIGTPLRGELTGPLGFAPDPLPTIEGDLQNIHGILGHFVRLSEAPSVASPKIPERGASSSAAPWSWTAAEAIKTESVLLPLLIHLAAASDDIEAMTDCIIKGADSLGGSLIPGGIINCLATTSSQSPLHVAAINNSRRCVQLLLRSGALVHLRDAQGHTALYYAARHGHEDIVDMLVEAGARLGSFDIEGGYVQLAVQTALRIQDAKMLRAWKKTGIDLAELNMVKKG